MKRHGPRGAWYGLCVAVLWLLPPHGLAQATSVEDRVNAILSQMTLGEKLTYIGGINNMSIRSIPRLGVPAILMSDGPMGTRTGSSTGYPGGIALAATWNTDLAARSSIPTFRLPQPWPGARQPPSRSSCATRAPALERKPHSFTSATSVPACRIRPGN